MTIFDKKNFAEVTFHIPIPTPAFEAHRAFHYTYPDRHLGGCRIITGLQVIHWEGDKRYIAYAESAIARVRRRFEAKFTKSEINAIKKKYFKKG